MMSDNIYSDDHPEMGEPTIVDQNTLWVFSQWEVKISGLGDNSDDREEGVKQLIKESGSSRVLRPQVRWSSFVDCINGLDNLGDDLMHDLIDAMYKNFNISLSDFSTRSVDSEVAWRALCNQHEFINALTNLDFQDIYKLDISRRKALYSCEHWQNADHWKKNDLLKLDMLYVTNHVKPISGPLIRAPKGLEVVNRYLDLVHEGSKPELFKKLVSALLVSKSFENYSLCCQWLKVGQFKPWFANLDPSVLDYDSEMDALGELKSLWLNVINEYSSASLQGYWGGALSFLGVLGLCFTLGAMGGAVFFVPILLGVSEYINSRDMKAQHAIMFSSPKEAATHPVVSNQFSPDSQAADAAQNPGSNSSIAVSEGGLTIGGV